MNCGLFYLPFGTMSRNLVQILIKDSPFCLILTHPRRPRGFYSGRCDIFGRVTILARKFTSRAGEPLGTFPYQTSCRSGRNLFRWLARKNFSGQSMRRSSRVILSLSYTKWCSSSIDLVTWPVQGEDSREEFQNKDLTKKRKLQTVTWELKIEAILFHHFCWWIYRKLCRKFV